MNMTIMMASKMMSAIRIPMMMPMYSLSRLLYIFGWPSSSVASAAEGNKVHTDRVEHNSFGSTIMPLLRLPLRFQTGHCRTSFKSPVSVSLIPSLPLKTLTPCDTVLLDSIRTSQPGLDMYRLQTKLKVTRYSPFQPNSPQPNKPDLTRPDPMRVNLKATEMTD